MRLSLVHIDPDWLRHQTERIDTRCGRPESTRALVVWNTGDAPVSGIAVFHADYRVRSGFTLPGILVTASDGTVMASSTLNFTEAVDEGEEDRPRIAFDLAFAIREIPARSWAAYFAAYAAEAGPRLGACDLDAIPRSLAVIETLCRAGELPMAGSFDNLLPFMLY